LAKKNRAYKSAKRAKELLRQQKREEKRLKRLSKDKPTEEKAEPAPGEETPESP
jgi:hypothetical protein